MENKINVAEILKSCPEGMELDCILFNNSVRYDSLDNDDNYPIIILTENDDYLYLTEEGYLYNMPNSKCVIFPKGKTTWEGFVPPCKFKVGDKVRHKGATSCGTVYEIEQIKRENNQVKYIICNLYLKNCKCTVTAEDLQPYKEETMEEKLMPRIDLTGYCKDKYIMDLGSYEIKEEKGVIYAVRKQSKYPKTYEECCKVLSYEPDRQTVTGYDAELIENLQTLKLCRDAYWKIAGDWEEKRKEKVIHYVIYSTLLGEVVKDATPNSIANYFLDFPTAEMRDAFCENFKELIESCKELL